MFFVKFVIIISHYRFIGIKQIKIFVDRNNSNLDKCEIKFFDRIFLINCVFRWTQSHVIVSKGSVTGVILEAKIKKLKPVKSNVR